MAAVARGGLSRGGGFFVARGANLSGLFGQNQGDVHNSTFAEQIRQICLDVIGQSVDPLLELTANPI